MRIESRARSRALQAVYAWDVRGNAQLDRVAQQVWDDLAVTPDERHLAGILVRTLLARGSEIDATLTELTTNWRLQRLGAIERSVLRIAAASWRPESRRRASSSRRPCGSRNGTARRRARSS